MRNRDTGNEASADSISKRTQLSGWWVLGSIVVGALLGAGVGVLIGYVTYEPSGKLFDFGRDGNAEAAGVAGVFFGAIFGPIALLIWNGMRDDRPR